MKRNNSMVRNPARLRWTLEGAINLALQVVAIVVAIVDAMRR